MHFAPLPRRHYHCCNHHCCGHTGRPYFGHDQVRYPHQIRKGLEYREMHNNDGMSVFTVVSEPFYRIESGWWIKVKYHHKWGDREDITSLQDHNIFPYKNSEHWNKSNWIAFTDKSRHLAHDCCHGHHCHSHDHHCHGCH